MAASHNTPALQALTASSIPHEVVRTGRARSVEEAAERRGIAVAALPKTLVVPGDRGIDWAKLRSHLGIRRMTLPDAAEALAVTGYERGTITPFGATTAWPVIADASIDPAGTISLGGGDHGVSVKMSAAVLIEALDADVADVTKLLD